MSNEQPKKPEALTVEQIHALAAEHLGATSEYDKDKATRFARAVEVALGVWPK